MFPCTVMFVNKAELLKVGGMYLMLSVTNLTSILINVKYDLSN